MVGPPRLMHSEFRSPVEMRSAAQPMRATASETRGLDRRRELSAYRERDRIVGYVRGEQIAV